MTSRVHRVAARVASEAAEVNGCCGVREARGGAERRTRNKILAFLLKSPSEDSTS